ncbi:DUF4214 domain-containing protein [Paraburkholderia sp. LEh10]|uniref:beta strand repeat-containing protein n=1 Tax=Paraburkholderia sp. LEh10 TaxID=2821353 RepID=UPI001AE51189|nr:DUF4214 domain-containing protein [Paraburkholderia sp. LEh10]MBP0595371.1 DUF4214 domain-containing protein [Paraburkholderia sp. LEh10]
MAAAQYYEQIQKAYIAYYGRPADPAGQDYWATQLDKAGGNLNVIINAFGNSVESTHLYGGSNTAAQVNAIYQTLFGRDADSAGLSFYVQGINNGTFSLASVALNIYNGATGNDATELAAKLSYADAFTAAVGQSTAAQVAYSGDAASNNARAALAAVVDTASEATASAKLPTTIGNIGAGSVAQTYNLTNGIDTVAGTTGNDVINAALTSTGADTFTSLDKIDGGAGNDTLNLVSSTGDLSGAAGATVTNVETVNLSSTAAITNADVSGWSGVKTLNVSSGDNIAGVVAAATTDINVAAAMKGVSVDGGNNVTINNSKVGDVVVGAATAAAGNVTVTNSAAGGQIQINAAGTETATASSGAIQFVGGTSVNATAAGAVSLADQVAHANALTAATIANNAAGSDSDASGLAKTAAANKVLGLGALSTAIAAATISSADAATPLSIQAATTAAFHAGFITAADKVAIDAAFINALATGTLADAVKAAQAVLTPLQTAATAASNAAIAADAVNDANAAAALAAANKVSAADAAAAAAVAAVSVTATSNTNLASATVTGNYGASNSISDGSTLHNTLTSVTLNNAGDTVITGQAVANVSATGMSADVTVNNTALNHAETFTLSGVTGGTYQDNAATTINIVSNGTATNVLTGLNASLATAVNVSGAAGVNFGDVSTSVNANAVIDASHSSGTNTIKVGAGQTYTGGAGADIVTAGAALQTKAVDGGAGAADKLILTSAAAFSTADAAALFKNFEIAQVNNGVTADLSTFTNSAFTSVVLHGGVGAIDVEGLTAVQAAHITVDASATATIGVAGATQVGQLDSVSITADDGVAGPHSTIALGLTIAGVETLNLNAVDDVTIGSLTGATALTNLNVTGAGNVNIVTGALPLNVNSVIDAHAVTGTVTVNASGALGNGLKIIGSATAANNLTSNALKSVLVGGDGGDTLTGGAGDDTISSGNGNNVIHGGAGVNTITVGNGDNTIDVGAGGSTITAGNGWNVINGGAGNDTIKVGTGGNLITGGADADVITFGAHGAGIVDGLKYAALSGTNDTGAAITATGAVTGLDIVTGLHAGDTINLGAAAGTLSSDLAGTFAHAVAAGTASAEIVRGTYDATAHTFTASASGADSMVQWADATPGNGTAAIVLVGYAGAAASHMDAAGVITLG